ncbi:FAD/NAD(P)-binding domain-containing protein [Annulohypoxylon nitens]|nr:FAD/NAD(P)-binding domain-containing protein [Annulohypoxylon nitens]
MADPTLTLIVGAGPSGISLGYHLKKKLRINDFVIVDKNAGVGGTWYSNNYPGCGCDVPSHFYSFSFALNPDWSKPLAEQGEILEYMNSVVDRFDLRPHILFETVCTGARWIDVDSTWEVSLQNVKTGHKYTRKVRIFVAGTGFFSRPKYSRIEGMDSFKGEIMHTAQWDHDYDIRGKKVAVIGNGCSGSQLVPAIAPQVKHITHYARSRQWLFPRPNQPFSAFDKFWFRWVPFALRWRRFKIYWDTDAQYLEYVDRPGSDKLRAQSEKEAREYMLANTPKKYRDMIIPDYPVGCKRRVFDPGYLDALHRNNVELVQTPISHIDEGGIVLQDGSRQDFDAIVFATGYSTQNFLAPMEIYGKGGVSLNEHWKSTMGCQAYNSVAVSGFPNLAILFGPNGAPAHNSAIFNIEVQVEFVIKTYFDTILSGRATEIDVKSSAEDYDCNSVQLGLKDSVWTSGCTNWTINEFGRNTTSYPDYVRNYWWKLYSPKFEDFSLKVR